MSRRKFKIYECLSSHEKHALSSRRYPRLLSDFFHKKIGFNLFCLEWNELETLKSQIFLAFSSPGNANIRPKKEWKKIVSKLNCRVLSPLSGNIMEIQRWKSRIFYYYLHVISRHAPQGAIWEGQYSRGVLVVVCHCFWQIEQGMRVDEAGFINLNAFEKAGRHGIHCI